MQAIGAIEELMGDGGGKRIKKLAWNTRYFRYHLHKMGFIVYGNYNSPVVPIMLFQPAKLSAFSREMLKRHIATVVVGYPATPVVGSRARICLSSAHTKEMLDALLLALADVGSLIKIRNSAYPTSVSEIIQKGEPQNEIDQ